MHACCRSAPIGHCHSSSKSRPVRRSDRGSKSATKTQSHLPHSMRLSEGSVGNHSALKGVRYLQAHIPVACGTSIPMRHATTVASHMSHSKQGLTLLMKHEGDKPLMPTLKCYDMTSIGGSTEGRVYVMPCLACSDKVPPAGPRDLFQS